MGQQAVVEPASAGTIVSYAGVIAGYLIPWGALASDFAIYIRPDAPSKRIFAYTYLGLLVPAVLLIILGAAIGGAVPNNPEWAQGYADYPSAESSQQCSPALVASANSSPSSSPSPSSETWQHRSTVCLSTTRSCILCY